jgi:hypothetical protein
VEGEPVHVEGEPVHVEGEPVHLVKKHPRRAIPLPQSKPNEQLAMGRYAPMSN